MKNTSFQFQHQVNGLQTVLKKLLTNKPNEILELKTQNDIKLHVREMEKRGTRIETEGSGYELADFDHYKNEILAELGGGKYRDLEDMVNRMELTYDENVDILDKK